MDEEIDIDVRVSVSLHPRTVQELPGYDDDTRPYLAPTEALVSDTYAALRAIHDAKAAAATNPTLNEYGQLLAVDDYASKRMAKITRSWDSNTANLGKSIASLEQELLAPVQSKAAQSVSQEIRAHVKALDAGKRIEFVRKAIEAGDETSATAVCGAPAYLSGLTAEMAAVLLRHWHEHSKPLVAKRLRALTAAKELLEARGGIVIGEWQKAVGCIEITKQGKNGPAMIVQRIYASEIREQKAKAEKPFAVGIA